MLVVDPDSDGETRNGLQLDAVELYLQPQVTLILVMGTTFGLDLKQAGHELQVLSLLLLRNQKLRNIVAASRGEREAEKGLEALVAVNDLSVIEPVEYHQVLQLVLLPESLHFASQKPFLQDLLQASQSAFDRHLIENEKELKFVGVEVDLLCKALIQPSTNALLQLVPLCQSIGCLKAGLLVFVEVVEQAQLVVEAGLDLPI